jgi:SAM-dependent methyltransferase
MLLSLLSLLYATQRKSRRTDSLFALDQPVIQSDQRQIDPVSVSRPALYQCPGTEVQNEAENVVTAPQEHHLWYEEVSERISNVSTYMATFREMEFDNWGHTYDEVKHGMFSWKSHYFSELRSGDIIYESACGIGMNLFMTLEILQQVLGITNITVYGNEYVARSVEVAKAIFLESSVLLPKSFGSIGSICAADSTQLDFVPSNSFDLVYTGYISPLFDPLHLNHSTTDENFVQYNSYCEQEDASFRHAAQQRQNDWYGSWVGEMIRIAKPGAPIIVEQVSYPYVVLFYVE